MKEKRQSMRVLFAAILVLVVLIMPGIGVMFIGSYTNSGHREDDICVEMLHPEKISGSESVQKSEKEDSLRMSFDMPERPYMEDYNRLRYEKLDFGRAYADRKNEENLLLKQSYRDYPKEEGFLSIKKNCLWGIASGFSEISEPENREVKSTGTGSLNSVFSSGPGPSPTDFGGPDAWGYAWTNSAGNPSVPYTWVDGITGGYYFQSYADDGEEQDREQHAEHEITFLSFKIEFLLHVRSFIAF